jgi:hypothetical protein
MGEGMRNSSNKLDRSVIAFHVSARNLAAALVQCGDQACLGILSALARLGRNIFIRWGCYND